jgi:putative restriction endonuclease
MPTLIPMLFTVTWSGSSAGSGPKTSLRAKIHHAAFDAHLIGVDPDYQIHVSDRLLEIHNGPFLELGLKGMAGTLIKLPRRSDDRPDWDRLARRFEEFKKAA